MRFASCSLLTQLFSVGTLDLLNNYHNNDVLIGSELKEHKHLFYHTEGCGFTFTCITVVYRVLCESI